MTNWRKMNKWLRWFAWRPVIISGKIVWLKWVYRKQTPRYDPGPLGAYDNFYKVKK